MKQTLVLTIILALFLSTCSGQEIKASNQSNSIQLNSNEQDEKQLEDLKQRFSVKYAGILSSSVWTLTHDYQSKTEVDNVLNFLKTFFTALQTNDKAKLQEIGGIKGFKDKFLEFLKSEDGTVKGFAAIVLGVTGDVSYAPPIAALLDKRDKSFTDRYTYPVVTYRGRAATALGIMGAKEYTSKIALLLKSQNDYDRSGAIYALTALGAKQYTKEVVSLLTNKDFQHIGDVSPIYFLIETGTAKDYKKELVAVMLNEIGSETAKAAIYALVHLESKENAKDIAKLLSSEFRKGNAAKALALLDAKEYIDEIASLLNDESSLVRNDAALALGILKARNHSSKIAELFKGKEGFVRYYAAVSLILMEAKEYYKDAIPIIEKSHQSGAYLNDGDFHPLVLDRSRQINANFKQLLEQAKSSN
jgi:HEAT repeat protein